MMIEDTSRPSGGFPAAGAARDAISGQDFRDAISRVPSAVHIVTTGGPAGRTGFTATAFASVSDAPPTILVCLNRKSPQNERVKTNACFSVNLLPQDGTELADVFAGRTGLHHEERFAHGSWHTLATGAPVLANAVMTLDCRLLRCDEVGSHSVLYGLVVATATVETDTAGTLLYRNRGYVTL